MTFTPLLGVSKVVRRFILEKSRIVDTSMTIDDAEHLTHLKLRAKIVASYPRAGGARTKGIPVLGSGQIFPVEDPIALRIPDIPAFSPLGRSGFWLGIIHSLCR